MIDRLRLSHFQCHEKLDLKLDQVTVFVGATDQGKSSIIRALRWLLMNKPLGNAFIQDGSDSVTVRARIDDRTVARSKGDRNLYRLDGEKYVAFGNDVPDQLRDLFCVDDLNFQGQHDSAFWFSMAAGDVAKQLNAIVDLSEIDRVSTKLNQIQRQAKTELTVANDRLKEADEEAARLEYVDELHESLTGLEEMQQMSDRYGAQYDELLIIVQKASAYLSEKSSAIEWIADADAVMCLGSALSESIAEVTKLAEFVDRVQSYLPVRQLPIATELHQLHADVITVDEQINALRKPIVQCDYLQYEIDIYRERLADDQKRLKKEFGDLCPVCGKKIPTSLPL